MTGTQSVVAKNPAPQPIGYDVGCFHLLPVQDQPVVEAVVSPELVDEDEPVIALLVVPERSQVHKIAMEAASPLPVDSVLPG